MSRPSLPFLLREQDLTRQVDRHQIFAAGTPLATLEPFGDVHLSLPAALSASTGPQDHPGGWLSWREHTALRCLSSCPSVRARAIRFRSHEWSNQLCAQADERQDEDLALVAEEFCIDSRIMLGAIAGLDLPPACIDLAERLFSVYRLGAWPCGWHGTADQGRLQILVRGTG